MRDKKKILVALSGGVDSAVSAALLKKQGFDVFGVFFRFFEGPGAKKSMANAKKVAQALEIPLEIIDARSLFKKKVIKYFVDSYKKGTTPNPCVYCNKEMKFRLLFEEMKNHKAEYIATGHYARIKRKTQNAKRKTQNEKKSRVASYALREASDKTKDQSYFLYRFSQKELSKIIFPLGEYRKTDIKKIAKKMGLPVAKEESQDICFLLDKDINRFLRKYIKPKSGNIVDEKRKILAKHQGLPFYTIGQRRGIEIGGTGPYFVIGKNGRKNELIVSNDPKKLLVKNFEINRVNWVNRGVKFRLSAKVQIRYHAEKVSVIIESGKSGKYIVKTKKVLRAVTPGQSAVFYKGGEVLGGGIITN
ncbi:MAG TPA: tRNA 2-thiouridine(34) synthase MnmA [Candidatus Bathyarchaeia archaeon]|nr:tRNA 2-thiouridine(34) synthase MnmA [Candidatus Bathyarchaeia archaeon]